jgi:hypothetical protein
MKAGAAHAQQSQPAEAPQSAPKPLSSSLPLPPIAQPVLSLDDLKINMQVELFYHDSNQEEWYPAQVQPSFLPSFLAFFRAFFLPFKPYTVIGDKYGGGPGGAILPRRQDN